MTKDAVAIRLEQFRQARRIHGGTLSMLGAALGVRLARTPIPTKTLRRKVYGMLYGSKYAALDESELEKPLDEFRSINELFTRGVKSHLRPIPQDEDLVLSPVDGTVQEIGTLINDSVMTIKGLRYTLDSLCPKTDTAPYRDGQFAILFLSPRDCHRVFSPAAGCIERMVHVPGHRLLVHPTFQKREFPVFTLNERLIIQLNTTLGRFLLIMVAGWGVGHISHPFRSSHRISPRRVTVTELNPPHRFDRVEWLATFELGSTVILITEKDKTLQSITRRDDRVQFGQPLFTTRADNFDRS